ncbi:hypothetical protein JCM16303_002707 [Sporobolomyces ruberrimus]
MPTLHQPIPQSDHEHELQTIRTTRRSGRSRESDDDDEVEGLSFGLDERHDDDQDEEEAQGLLRSNEDDLTRETGRGEGDTMTEGEEKELASDSTTTRTRSNSTTSARSTQGGTGMTSRQKRAFVKEMISETLPVFLLVLIGAILTGELLDKLQAWRVFIRIEELFILVPILLNLKGNLEMNLAARFSTSANIGELDLRRTRRSLILGNLALLQVQALIVSLLSGLLAFILGLLSRKGVHHSLQHPIHKVPGMIGTDQDGNDIRGGYFEALLVLCVSMLAAGISSGVLGSFMCALVVICRRFKINPDNVATPIAAILGDVVTLVILGGLASLFAKFMGTIISTLVFLSLLVAVLVNLVFTFRNAYVQELLSVGWGPLFLAMIISSGTGVVLETYVNAYPGFSLLAPIFTSISAAPASILVARTSTSLHSAESTKRLKKKGGESVWFTGGILWSLGVGVIGMSWAFGLVMGQVPRGWVFGLGYWVAAGVQVLVGLVIAKQGSMLLWKWDYDPDVYALPLLSSFLDVSGQLLLVVAFEINKKTSSSSIGGVIPDSTTTTTEKVVVGGEVLDGLIRRFLG